MDIDDNTSHVEGNATNVLSAGETESESENEQIELPEEDPETPYIQEYEEEFGAVSCHLIKIIFKAVNAHLFFFHKFRPVSKLKN